MACAFGCGAKSVPRAPQVVTVETRFYNEAPDAYELVSLDVSVEGRTEQVTPEQFAAFRRDRAMIWRTAIHHNERPWMNVTATFRREGVVTSVNARQVLAATANAVFDFYEAETSGKKEVRERAYVDPNRTICLAAGSGPSVTHNIKLVDKTTTGFRIDHVRLELDGRSLISDEPAVLEGLRAGKWPTLTSKIAQGCHVLDVGVTLRTTEKSGAPERDIVVATTHAFDAFEARTEKVLVFERVSARIEDRPAFLFIDVP
jgi:hypothetical protein